VIGARPDNASEHEEGVVLNPSVVCIPAKDWDAFEVWMQRPAIAVPALAELLRRTPSWLSSS
jgi:hypothetical protein